MEYLTVSGEVKIVDPDNSKLCQLLDKLKDIKFEDGHCVDICVDSGRLSMQGEGEMPTAQIYTIVMLLNEIDQYTIPQSYFVINRSKWEAMIKLISSESVIGQITLAA